VLRNAQERGHRVDAAIFSLRPPRHEEREPRFLTWLEVERLASYCAEGRLVAFAALTGLRQRELFALRSSGLDLANGVVRVERASRAARSLGRSPVGSALCISLLLPLTSRRSN
jgi:integrase